MLSDGIFFAYGGFLSGVKDAHIFPAIGFFYEVQMNKDTYYFPHDSNARGDPKLTKLMIDLKGEGYAVFFITIEMLREAKEYKLNKTDYDAIAYQSHSNCINVAQALEHYGLFEFDNDGNFWSNSLNKRMAHLAKKRETMRENALKRWNKERVNAKAMQLQCKSNASKVKESKVKESKVKESKVLKSIKPKNQALITQDFITSLKNNVAYKHIDLEREFAKMDAWLSLPNNHGRQKTPRFVLNWLNKIEKPLASYKPMQIVKTESILPINPEEHKKVSELIRQTVNEMGR
jgi:hypothetical protein